MPQRSAASSLTSLISSAHSASADAEEQDFLAEEVAAPVDDDNLRPAPSDLRPAGAAAEERRTTGTSSPLRPSSLFPSPASLARLTLPSS